MRKPRANERQQRRVAAIEHDLWCSFGQHHTFKHPGLKEQYPGGTVCLSCQVAMMLVPQYGLPTKLMHKYKLHEAGRKAKNNA